MQKVSSVVYTLFRCGFVGGVYGAVLGMVYAGLLCISEGLRARAPDILVTLPLPIAYGAWFGFPAGFISGVLGAGFGGPIGCGIGGLIGTGAAMVLCVSGLGGQDLRQPVLAQWGATVMRCIRGVDGFPAGMFGLYPCSWGAAFGLVLGLHIRRRVPLFPGVEWLADSIYGSPLGGWLGWRQRCAR